MTPRAHLPASAYFDTLRIGATVAVALGHLSTQRYTGGLGWQLGHVGPSRVVFFFVLSGFLIAASLDRPNATPRGFAVSRASRLASAALPALALTVALDTLGAMLDSALYADLAPPFSPLWLEQHARAITLTTMTWGSVGSPGSNWAWWTLGIEAACCVLFGVLVFTRGRTRVLGVVAVLLSAGPIMAVLAPTWLAGALSYRLAVRRTLSPSLAAVLALAPVATWLAWEVARVGQPLTPRVLPQDHLILTYLTAAGVALHLAGAWMLAPHLPRAPDRLAAMLRWAAGATFTVYLLHMPLARALATASPWGDPAGWSHRTLMIGGVLLAALAVAEVTERRRAQWRAAMEAAVRWAARPWRDVHRTSATRAEAERMATELTKENPSHA